MSEYVFYFDESYHDQIIRFNDNGLNIKSKNLLDTFIGSFWGCKSDELPEIMERLSSLEKKHKSALNIPTNCEFKTTTLKKKHFMYGLKTFNTRTLEFYSDLFHLIDDSNMILHVDLISKTEFLIEKIFSIHDDAIQYTLTKFITYYGNNDIFSALQNAHDGRTNDMLRRQIMYALKQI